MSAAAGPAVLPADGALYATNLHEIKAAAERIKLHAHTTPVSDLLLCILTNPVQQAELCSTPERRQLTLAAQ